MPVAGRRRRSASLTHFGGNDFARYFTICSNSASVASTNWTSGTLTIGRRNDGVTWFVGDLAEVVITDAPLGSTDRLALEAYLKAKWGTP